MCVLLRQNNHLCQEHVGGHEEHTSVRGTSSAGLLSQNSVLENKLQSGPSM